MADWAPTVAEELRRDVRFALGWKVGKKLRSLTDTERNMVAIVEHRASDCRIYSEAGLITNRLGRR
jgi:hypothetical protein